MQAKGGIGMWPIERCFNWQKGK